MGLFFFPFAVPANWCAKLYQHSYYRGWVHAVKATGAYANLPGNKNDQVSSVVVRSGCVFKAYRHYYGNSIMATITGNKAYVGRTSNDHLSSYSCKCPGMIKSILMQFLPYGLILKILSGSTFHKTELGFQIKLLMKMSIKTYVSNMKGKIAILIVMLS